MNESLSLVDLGPAASVALAGALLALLPLLWAARRLWREGGMAAWRRPVAWQRALTLATLFLTLDLVVFGAFTRLTDSGLGCPDWPGCYGSASPVGAHGEITQALQEAPHGPVSHGKAWIEMIHRYLATGVGALITGLMALAWWSRGRASAGEPLISPWWPTWTFVWVCVQGAFGALTVTLKLYPLIVTGHLLGGLTGVALLAAQARALATPSQASSPQSVWAQALPEVLRRSAGWVLAVWVLQAMLGAWVSTNGAVLACAEFPLCQSQWVPDMDWRQGFTLLRGLGEDGQGGTVTLAALTAIHMAHRLGAIVATLAMLWLAWRAMQLGARSHGRILLALLGWQVATGLSNVVLGWPLLAALGHTLGAALTVAWLTGLAVSPLSKPVSQADQPTRLRARWAS
ncbi:MAG TPA: COX15/CtaA family protein [Aquabacterium sp.]|uniref:COX15/CtaA family protein n=1 Tax=Aquabacterium sp. TaxID=1872578 RepID=UPI002E3682A2|nr:COX15/CtaA family protein [Aquabacterium sp.]HEX5372379.1 COX15/CtaA family protein [Aquabacterium sp.]